MKSCRAMTNVLELFAQESGLRVNPQKSVIHFSRSMDPQVRHALAQVFGIQGSGSMQRYPPGLPTIDIDAFRPILQPRRQNERPSSGLEKPDSYFRWKTYTYQISDYGHI